MMVVYFSRCLLLAVAGEAEAEFVAGDLDEEWIEVVALRGRWAAECWYLRQVLCSIAPLLALRVRSGELTGTVLAGVAGAALPLWLCDRLWSFLYSQIPLKDGPGRTPGQLGLTLAILCLGAALAGATSRSRARAVAIAGSVLVMTAIGLALATGATPALYVAAALALAPASSLGASMGRRSK